MKGKQTKVISVVALLCVALALLVVYLPKSPASARVELSDVEIEINRAVAMVRGDSPMEGIGKLKALEEQMPNHPELNYHLGVFSVVTQQYVKAIPRLEIAVKVPRFEEAYVYLFESYQEIGNQKAAADILEKAKAGKFAKETNESIIELYKH